MISFEYNNGVGILALPLLIVNKANLKLEWFILYLINNKANKRLSSREDSFFC